MTGTPFSVPAAAGFRGGPIPVGKPVKVDADKLSPSERQALSRLGWDGKSAIPENLAALQKQAEELARRLAAEATDAEELPPPCPWDTPPLQLPPEKKLEDLSEEEQEKYRQILAEMFAAAETEHQRQQEIEDDIPPGAGPGIAEAVAAAHEPPAEAKPEKKPQPAEKKPAGRCSRCGHPADQDDPVKVSSEDETRFVEACLAGQPFRKTYRILDGRMSVLVRSTSMQEEDLLHRQLVSDKNHGRVEGGLDVVAQMLRYQTVLQVERVVSGQTPLWSRPELAELSPNEKEKLDGDTPLPAAVRRFLGGPAGASQIHHILSRLVADFNSLSSKLEDRVTAADF